MTNLAALADHAVAICVGILIGYTASTYELLIQKIKQRGLEFNDDA